MACAILEKLRLETIVAIATGQGGALGIVRVSGEQALPAADKIFNGRKPLEGARGGSLHYGWIKDGDELLDEVVVSVYRAPHSYTGEDCVEISCHNSPYVLQRVLDLLLQEGCRMAQPGEFTKRAFLNGKKDLSQAEAVADLICARSRAAHAIAMNQMCGNYSSLLRDLRDRLLRLTALLELELDFSDQEDARFVNRDELLRQTTDVEECLQKLADSFRAGSAIRNGIPVAIVGEPNVGKSMLLNRLLGDERAIVSPISGTTRDTIEDTIIIRGLCFRFIDTAGLRETNDEIEKIGIDRTLTKIKQASVVIWLTEATAPKPLPKQFAGYLTDKEVIEVANKIDLLTQDKREKDRLYISAKTGEGMPELLDLLVERANIPELGSETTLVSSLRHHEAIMAALQDARRVKQGLAAGIPSDLIAQDLRACTTRLSEIIGEVTTETILSAIFSHFCIGK